MKDNCFIDTNIFVYAHTNLASGKQEVSQHLLKSENLFISTQVLNELISVFRKKFNKDWKSIENIIAETCTYYTIHTVNEETINKAIGLAVRYDYSYFDSLIIASALECNCKTLYSEDLQNKQIINKVLTIKNPFN
jgi:predicted nucleic acid-binding protein